MRFTVSSILTTDRDQPHDVPHLERGPAKLAADDAGRSPQKLSESSGHGDRIPQNCGCSRARRWSEVQGTVFPGNFQYRTMSTDFAIRDPALAVIAMIVVPIFLTMGRRSASRSRRSSR
jgi:hypothetical protein